MSISPTPATPVSAPAARPRVTATKVSDVSFDFGEDYYNGPDGNLAVRPATKGLVHLNLKTLEASEDKIQAIQNRVAELEKSGAARRDAAGNLNYSNEKTGESVKVETQNGTTVYEQSFVAQHKGWFSRNHHSRGALRSPR